MLHKILGAPLPFIHTSPPPSINNELSLQAGNTAIQGITPP